MKLTPHKHPRAGFTMLELIIAVSLLGLVLGNVFMLMDTSNKAANSSISESELELQAQRTLDRIALAIMSSSRDDLDPQGEGTPLTTLNYRYYLGMLGGVPEWSSVERIELNDPQDQIEWTEDPTGVPRRVVWTHYVSDFLEGEIPANGLDDNANGVTDEAGLTFVIVGAQVRVILTLQRQGPGGRVIVKTEETIVTCRN